MRSKLGQVLVITGSLGVAVCAADVHQVRAEGAENAPAAKDGACVQVTSEARFRGLAFDHVVTLDNQCKKAATCTVKTDVNPDPTTVELAVKEQKSVVTFMGSPARVFTPIVSCHEHD